MPALPPPETSPKEYLEHWLPKAAAEQPFPEAAKNADVKLGVRLEGEGGGDWVFHLREGQLSVSPGPTEDAAFTLIQSVADWRGAVWEGRGGAFGKQASALFRPGSEASQATAGPGGRPLDPSSLSKLAALKGVIRMVVSGGGDDWKVDFKLGPGPIPADPNTTVTITAEDAAAMERGELDPMQAFMSGRIMIAGDMGLLMQMQMMTMA